VQNPVSGNFRPASIGAVLKSTAKEPKGNCRGVTKRVPPLALPIYYLCRGTTASARPTRQSKKLRITDTFHGRENVMSKFVTISMWSPATSSIAMDCDRAAAMHLNRHGGMQAHVWIYDDA